MVDAHGQATLVDFGLSKLTADHQTAEVWFTPGYAAPEVFQGKRTPNTDRYAFGAIACYLLSGEPPPGTPEQLRAALGELPQLAALTPERRERVLALCATDPAARPESLRAWVKDLRDTLVSTTGRAPEGTVRDAVPPLPPGMPTTTEMASTATAPKHPAQDPPYAAPAPAPAPAARPAPAPPKKSRPVLVPALAVALAASLGVIGVQALAKDGKDGDKASPGPTVTVTKSPEAGGSAPDASASTPSGGESGSTPEEPGQVADAETLSLTTMDVAAEGRAHRR